MKKRSVKIGNYDTAGRGWTLAGCTLSDPDLKEHFVEKTGGDGSWNLTTAMTGGLPRYRNRTLTIDLECSEGTRDDRESLINELVNGYDGLEHQIVLPDRPDHYLVGQVRVAVNYSDLAHAAVTVTANCEPWLYRARETVVELYPQMGVAQYETLHNAGRRAVVPTLHVTGTATLHFDAFSITLENGAYKWPQMLLTPGAHELTYIAMDTGSTIEVRYREAVLR